VGTQTIEQELIETAIGDAFSGLWAVIVHNDDITTFETVITALIEIFNHARPAAEALAWTVHHGGLAQVAIGAKEFALDGVSKLRERRIVASAEPLGV
jgi:ATP-dependent Clp protease adapter protein ClpS